MSGVICLSKEDVLIDKLHLLRVGKWSHSPVIWKVPISIHCPWSHQTCEDRLAFISINSLTHWSFELAVNKK